MKKRRRMNVGAILRVAARALARNKTRSALTMLGIIIGVSAVIAMVSIGLGAQSMVQTQISSMGSNLLFVLPGNVVQGGASLGSGAAMSLTEEDVASIEREVLTVAAATPVVNAQAQVVFSNQNWSLRLLGTNERSPEIRNWPVTQGAFFTAADVRAAARVIVLGKTPATKLFGTADPVGQWVRVRNLPFRVVGVLAEKGQSFGQDQDDIGAVPYTTVQKKLSPKAIAAISQVMVSASSERGAALAETQIRDLLRQRHRIRDGETDDFVVRNMSDVAATSAQITTILTALLGSIAAISLLVGGIGIMNIMLVSVTERTREIGIRMAIGARPNYIRAQFLTESVVLSLVGGAIGMALGAGAAVLVARSLGLPSTLSGVAVLLAFGFSTGIGVFFGYYPAHKAAALDPIDALRYE